MSGILYSLFVATKNNESGLNYPLKVNEGIVLCITGYSEHIKQCKLCSLFRSVSSFEIQSQSSQSSRYFCLLKFLSKRFWKVEPSSRVCMAVYLVFIHFEQDSLCRF